MIVRFSNFRLDVEKAFALLALLFYSELLAFQSVFSLSEGEGATLFAEAANSPLTPLLRLTQHGVFIVTIVLLALRWRQTLRTSARGSFIWGLLLLTLLSFLWSDTPAATERGSISLLETTLFGLYFAARFTLKEQLQILSICGSIFVVVSLLFSAAMPGAAIEAGVHPGAWRGPLIQKNLFARALVLFGTVTYIHQPEGCVGKTIRGLTLLLCVLLIVLSTSKTALVILILMLGLVESQKFLYRLFLTLPMLFVPIVCVALLAVMVAVVATVNNAEAIVDLTGRDLTLSGRTEIWGALITKIEERPLLGYGYLGFWRGIYGESAYIGKVFGSTYLPPHSHNGFFELTLAFGLLGLGVFALSFLINARFALLLPVIMPSTVALWPLTYLFFLALYNQTESTLVAHNSIFWTLYVALTFSKAIALEPVDETPIDKTVADEMAERSLTKTKLPATPLVY